MADYEELTPSGAAALRKYKEGERRLLGLISSETDKRVEYELELYLIYLNITNILIKIHQYSQSEAYIARAENLSKSIQTSYYALDEKQWTGYMVNQASFCNSKSICDFNRGNIKASFDDAFYGICVLEHVFQLVEKTEDMNKLYRELKAEQARALGEMAESCSGGESEIAIENPLKKSLDIWDEISHQDEHYLAEYAGQLNRAADQCDDEERQEYLHHALEIYLRLSDLEGSYIKEVLELTILYGEELLLNMPETKEEFGRIFAEAEFYVAAAMPNENADAVKLLAEFYFLQYCWLKECGESKEARVYFRKYLKQHRRWLTCGGILRS